MSAHSLFTAFNKRLKPTTPESDLALQRAMSCAIALTKHYYGTQEASEHITFIGSTVKHTSVRPIADVDLVFHMPPGTYAKYDEHTGNGQSALLQDVRATLLRRFPSTSIKGDGPVVVVEFSTGPAVEVVPGTLYKEPDILEIECAVPVTRGGGRWETTDYGAQFHAFHDVNRARDYQLARLVRYLKAWRRTQEAVIKTLMLETMAINFFKTWDRRQEQTSATFDDWLVRDLLAYMVENQDTVYRIPGTSRTITAGYGWRQDAASSLADARRACEAPESSNAYMSNWRKVLGSGFGL